MHDVSQWLHLIALGSLGLACLCAAVIFAHITGHPQRMGIMDGVWPIAALFGSVLVLIGYFRYGAQDAEDISEQERKPPPFARGRFIAAAVARLATSWRRRCC